MLGLVPEVGPIAQEEVYRQTVKVTWTEVPRSQRRGCITKYTIYLMNADGHQQPCKNYFICDCQGRRERGCLTFLLTLTLGKGLALFFRPSPNCLKNASLLCV